MVWFRGKVVAEFSEVFHAASPASTASYRGRGGQPRRLPWSILSQIGLLLHRQRRTHLLELIS